MDQAPAFRIRKLHLESYGCVKDATIEPSLLTVLVGPNDSGKSMLLRALTTLSALGEHPSGCQGIFPDIETLAAQTFNGRGQSIRWELEGHLGDDRFEYDLTVGAEPTYTIIRKERLRLGALALDRAAMEITVHVPDAGPKSLSLGDGVWPLHHPRSAWGGVVKQALALDQKQAPPPGLSREALQPLSAAIHGLRVFSLRPENLRLPAPPGTALAADGSGLSAALAEVLLNDRDMAERLEAALSSAMPHVKRLGVTQQRGEHGVEYDIQIVNRSGARIPSPMISDGVLLYLGYLYLVLGPHPASVLLVEEPETGIHFGLLRGVMKLFRDMTTGAHGGPPTQVILTTHSPLLLNLVEPGEILVIRRDDEGATRVFRFSDAPDLDELLDYQGPGEVWVNQGEDYLTRSKVSPR